MSEKACIVYSDMLTAYGHGPERCMEALYAGRPGFREITRFPVGEDSPKLAACFPVDLVPDTEERPAEKAMTILLDRMDNAFPLSGFPAVFWALTQGEISLLDNAEKVWTAKLLEREIAKKFSPGTRSTIFSASCASGNIALARAAAEIEAGHLDLILVAGCDLVSEFTFSGFASVHAVTPGICRPYDLHHDGLLLGDAAGVLVLASEEKAEKSGWEILAVLEGYGITTDAYHAAAPDPEGCQMARAMEMALAGCPKEKIGGIIGHGTGTVLNDDMEIAALNKVFPEGRLLASVKGGTGHILAASGLIQASCAAEVLARGEFFPQTSLDTPQKGAEKFVSNRACPLRGEKLLTVNAGFGGLNAVLRIGRSGK